MTRPGDAVGEFFSRFRARIQAGVATYGVFNPATDKRILSVEAQEECLDIGSYLSMLGFKHPELEPKIKTTISLAIATYECLKDLEVAELKLRGGVPSE